MLLTPCSGKLNAPVNVIKSNKVAHAYNEAFIVDISKLYST
jgi:hypothetical protein